MKSVNFNGIRPIGGELIRPQNGSIPGEAGEFSRTLNSILPSKPDAIKGGAQSPAGLKFSNHAVDRMRSRGIRFSPDDLARIGQAVAKADAKGAKDCLLLGDQSALIVSLKDKTVVTVMDKTALKENVFTNIDAAVFY